jgi:phage tail sheath protein FI
MLEQSIERSTGWAAVEPNDEQLWVCLRESVGSFMFALHQRGAFAGATPRDNCFVKCDEQTTTARDVEKGVVNVLAGFAPLRPAEFVILRISRSAGRAAR